MTSLPGPGGMASQQQNYNNTGVPLLASLFLLVTVILCVVVSRSVVPRFGLGGKMLTAKKAMIAFCAFQVSGIEYWPAIASSWVRMAFDYPPPQQRLGRQARWQSRGLCMTGRSACLVSYPGHCPLQPQTVMGYFFTFSDLQPYAMMLTYTPLMGIFSYSSVDPPFLLLFSILTIWELQYVTCRPRLPRLLAGYLPAISWRGGITAAASRHFGP